MMYTQRMEDLMHNVLSLTGYMFDEFLASYAYSH